MTATVPSPISYDITILSAYASANVSGFSKDARAPILRREDEKHKRYDVRLATIGPGLKLFAFGFESCWRAR